MLYTRKGDKGESGLFGTKNRFPKNSPVFEALGTVDELNSLLGVCRAYPDKGQNATNIGREILKVQEDLFIIQAELAGADKTITQNNVDDLELLIERLENKIKDPTAFIIPGATEFSALCDYARTVSRRAERTVISAQPTHRVSASTLAYLNRLSSYLYALARYAASIEETPEPSPQY